MNIQTITEQLPSLAIDENVELAPLTYMKIGGPARIYCEAHTVHELTTLCQLLFRMQEPFVILGGASNVLIPDDGLRQVVIRNCTSSISLEPENDHVVVTADSGVITAVLAHRLHQENLTGFEYFVGVPGTIGGAVFNNSHFSAYELIGNHLLSVKVCTSDGNITTWPVTMLQLGYDYSIFHERKDVILSATFLLKKGDPVAIQEAVRIAAKKRADTQPIGTPSSGCMYRNPVVTAEQLDSIRTLVTLPEGAIKRKEGSSVQIAAGFLIEAAGLKGRRIGDIAVSEKHATYIVNVGQGKSVDVIRLCNEIETTVREKFGVTLEREVFFLEST